MVDFMKVLIAADIADEAVSILQKKFDVEIATGLDENTLCKKVSDVDAVIVRSKPKITRKIIESAPKLKIIGRAGVGIDNIDQEACKERGIKIINSPTALSESVAELVFAMMLAFERNIVKADNSLKRGMWLKKDLKGNELYEKTIGIIGFGRIGSHIAKMAKGFGMNVIAYDVHWNQELALQFDVEFKPIDTLLQEADYITLHVPLLPQTRGMISKKEFGVMKNSAVIINSARGGVVDEKALYEALASGRIRGACLDVFEREPPTDSPLLSLGNVIVTPHLGASTREAQVRAGLIIARKIIDELGD
ncbi:MAG: hydroxyacid dehydrogenase [Candidatus Methanofastidiosia archaeon]